MLLLNYKRQFLKIKEVYGKGLVTDSDAADVTICIQLLTSLEHEIEEATQVKLIKHKHSFELMIPNFLIDLSQQDEDLFRHMSKSVRADIIRAERDGFSYLEDYSPTDEQILEFSRFYNTFAKEKNLEKCVTDRLINLRNNNALLITAIMDNEKNIICSHCSLLDTANNQSYGLYAASVQLADSKGRRMVGRATKLLHWKEIQNIKKSGYRWYNMGGVVVGKQGQGVNEFKMKFGAVRGYDCRTYQFNTLLGLLSKIHLLRKWKRNLVVNKAVQKSKRKVSLL